jgi:hypothetical protein
MQGAALMINLWTVGSQASAGMKLGRFNQGIGWKSSGNLETRARR